MRKQKFLFSVLVLSAILCLTVSRFSGLTSCTKHKTIDVISRTASFDDGWHFIKDSLSGAENPDFNDSNWRVLDVPHDWSIEDLPGQDGNSIIGPFDKSAIDKMSSGYLVGGTGWYRKSFSIREEDKDKIAYLQFDGVYMNSDVWLNGKHLGFHPYGYTPFYYNITSFLNPAGEANVVAVRVKNDGLNSRWYSGSGINRHVWLTLVNPVHIDVSGGIYVTTPSVNKNSADVKIIATLVNSGNKDENIVLHTELLDPSGRVSATSTDVSKVAADQTIELTQEFTVFKPYLWSVDDPNLYNARVSVLCDEKIVDSFETPFGIRGIKIDAQYGLTINGKSLDMVGGCYHHDNGPLGAASIDRAEERKIEILKKTGFNAIRTSHNPPSPALLDACDRLGMVVINEIFDMWETLKKGPGLSFVFQEMVAERC